MTRYRKWRDPRSGTWWVVEDCRARNALVAFACLSPWLVAALYAWVIH